MDVRYSMHVVSQSTFLPNYLCRLTWNLQLVVFQLSFSIVSVVRRLIAGKAYGAHSCVDSGHSCCEPCRRSVYSAQWDSRVEPGFIAISSLGDDLRYELIKPILESCNAATLLRLEQASPVCASTACLVIY